MIEEVLLDGKSVDKKIINPKTHKFIGMFRRPFNGSGGGYVMCSCGEILQTMDVTYAHWQSGHWDTPQYVSIQKEKK